VRERDRQLAAIRSSSSQVCVELILYVSVGKALVRLAFITGDPHGSVQQLCLVQKSSEGITERKLVISTQLEGGESDE